MKTAIFILALFSIGTYTCIREPDITSDYLIRFYEHRYTVHSSIDDTIEYKSIIMHNATENDMVIFSREYKNTICDSIKNGTEYKRELFTKYYKL